jgi:hypothetical protein
VGILHHQVSIHKLCLTGALDAEWGVNGVAHRDVHIEKPDTGNWFTLIKSFTVEKGEVYVGGTVYENSQVNAFLAKFDRKGISDNTFGYKGLVFEDRGTGNYDYFQSIAVLSDGTTLDFSRDLAPTFGRIRLKGPA